MMAGENIYHIESEQFFKCGILGKISSCLRISYSFGVDVYTGKKYEKLYCKVYSLNMMA